MEAAISYDAGVNTPEYVGLQVASRFKRLSILKRNLDALGVKHTYTQREIKKFEKNMSVLFDARNIVKHIKEGSVTYEMASNFKDMYPRKYNEMRYNLIQSYLKGELKGSLTFSQRNQLSKFLDFDFTGVRGGVSDEDRKGLGNVSPRETKRKVDLAKEHQSATSRVENL